MVAALPCTLTRYQGRNSDPASSAAPSDDIIRPYRERSVVISLTIGPPAGPLDRRRPACPFVLAWAGRARPRAGPLRPREPRRASPRRRRDRARARRTGSGSASGPTAISAARSLRPPAAPPRPPARTRPPARSCRSPASGTARAWSCRERRAPPPAPSRVPSSQQATATPSSEPRSVASRSGVPIQHSAPSSSIARPSGLAPRRDPHGMAVGEQPRREPHAPGSRRRRSGSAPRRRILRSHPTAPHRRSPAAPQRRPPVPCPPRRRSAAALRPAAKPRAAARRSSTSWRSVPCARSTSLNSCPYTSITATSTSIVVKQWAWRRPARSPRRLRPRGRRCPRRRGRVLLSWTLGPSSGASLTPSAWSAAPASPCRRRILQPALGLLLARARERDRRRRHAQDEGRVEIGGGLLSHSATSWVRARARARSGAMLSCSTETRGRSPARSIVEQRAAVLGGDRARAFEARAQLGLADTPAASRKRRARLPPPRARRAAAPR